MTVCATCYFLVTCTHKHHDTKREHAVTSPVLCNMVSSYTEPCVYLRVGASGSGHSRFIHDLTDACDLHLLMRLNGTAKRWFANGSCPKRSSFYPTGRIVAFDGISPKQMCTASNVVYIAQDSKKKKINTYVFSLDDRRMKPSCEIDADDVLKYAFGGDGHRNHYDMLYRRITEIHHMLPNGTVRILASEGEKLVHPIVLTRSECLNRQILRLARGDV